MKELKHVTCIGRNDGIFNVGINGVTSIQTDGADIFIIKGDKRIIWHGFSFIALEA